MNEHFNINCCCEHDVQKIPSSKVLRVQGISDPQFLFFSDRTHVIS